MQKVRIIKKEGIISTSRDSSKEINIVEWQDSYKVIDIRKWQEGVALKGISLNLKEAEKLHSLLSMAIADLKVMLNSNVENIDLDDYGLNPLTDDDLRS